MGLGRKVVRGVIVKHKRPASTQNQMQPRSSSKASKLDPFREQIEQKVKKDLTVSRILREIRERSYTGSRTILADYVRTLRVQPQPKKKVYRRFETQPGEELQIDWSPYRVPLGGKQRVVHAFAATLGYCRKTHVRFYADERQSTLFEAHTHAFADFDGVALRLVYDRMATVVLGTVGPNRKPLWNPRLLEFARYYGYEPYLCKVADPNRKGKDERIFLFLERDFIRGSEFDSFEDLNAKVRIWLDEVANCRVHGTTRRVPDEVWEQEKPFLIPLPESSYPACDEEIRQVGPDAVLWIRGTTYTIPAALANQKVSVRLYTEHFEVLDRNGRVAFSRRHVPEQEKGRLVIDPSHYDDVKRRSAPLPGGPSARLEDAFLKRFPTLAELVAGIKRKMKNLSHVHLRTLWRLADRYGEEAFIDTATRVQSYRRFDAHAVRRILERDHPLVEEEPPTALRSAARVLVELGDVDSGSLDDYAYLDGHNEQDENAESPEITAATTAANASATGDDDAEKN
ncbi:MAG: IS21 family transposase [Candidatus Eisenbacteria sp.]|nr:IS21 family transposase [Candidatus Eisenbacteria bacterium]